MFCLMPMSLLASTSFYKCTLNGITVYSEKPCSERAVKSTIEDIYIGQKTTGNPKTAEQQLQNFLKNKAPHVRKKQKNKSNTSCDDIPSLTLRNAAIKEQLLKCHSEKDVHSIYGAPSKIKTYSDSKYYDQRWKYKFNFNEGIMYIYFKNGLVTKWTKQD